MKITIRAALTHEHEILTDITLSSKHVWNYPEEFYRIWERELTITPEYIDINHIFVAETEQKEVVAYLSIVEVGDDVPCEQECMRHGYWIEHMFVKPEYIGKGIGKKLMNFAYVFCRDNKIPCLYVFSDPHAKGFYIKSGGKYLGESPSRIEGRTLPFIRLVPGLLV